ncbi:MAG: IMP cyclohydrolase [Oscillospiraceae bacterium]
MEFLNINNELCKNTYPGRGIIIGKSEDGENAVVAYFIMGRSENSRNRIFEEQGNGIRTRAFDESKMIDPSLIIYSPVRVIDDLTIVTNGDQTDTIFEFINDGGTFEQALRTRTFEPDPPNFTPRVSGIIKHSKNDFSYKLSILKSDNGNENSAQRFFYEYENPQKAEGHFIHTYLSDGNPIPSFEGEPTPIKITGDIDTFTNNVWDSLNESNKVSLFTRFLNLKTGEFSSRIINKNK